MLQILHRFQSFGRYKNACNSRTNSPNFSAPFPSHTTSHPSQTPSTRSSRNGYQHHSQLSQPRAYFQYALSYSAQNTSFPLTCSNCLQVPQQRWDPTLKPSRSATCSSAPARSVSIQLWANLCVLSGLYKITQLMSRLDGQVEGGVDAQAEQALKNLKAIVEAGGSELGKVVKTTVRPTRLRV